MPYAGDLYYEEHGSGPPLILSAGLGGSAHYWEPNVAALAAHFRVIAYDHRGTGRCNTVNLPPSYHPSIDDMAQDVVDLMEATAIDSAHFVGHALGGLIGLALAQQAPGRLARMVAVNSWMKADPFTSMCFDARLAILTHAEWRGYARLTPVFLYPPQWMADNAERLSQMTADQADERPSISALMARIDAIRAFDATSWIGDLTTPTLALGAKDDMLVPYTASERLAAASEAIQLSLMNWGGHACNVTDPDAFNRIVLDFLRS